MENAKAKPYITYNQRRVSKQKANISLGAKEKSMPQVKYEAILP